MKKGQQQTAKKKVRGSGLSINVISILSFIIFNILLTAGLYVGQQDPLQTLSLQRQDVADNITKQTAYKFAAEVDKYSQVLHGIANDPKLVKLFVDNDQTNIFIREQELINLFPAAMKVRMLTASTSQPDKTTEPHFTYACLDLMRQSKADGLPVIVEMHEIEGKQQHVDMMQAVQRNGIVIGYIQVAMNASILNKWIDKVAGDTYLEVHQRINNVEGVLIGKSGKGDKQGIHAVSKVPGTNWYVEIWAPYESTDSAFNPGMLFALIAGIALSAIFVFILRTMLHKELKSDLDKYLMLVMSILRNEKKIHFEFSLDEFKEAAKHTSNIKLDKNSMEREHDNETTKKSVQASLPDSDPMFMDKNAIALEELDDTDESAFDELDELDDTSVTEAAPAAVPANLPGLPEVIFKAYDIRGIVGKTLTVENIEYIGKAIGSEAKARGLSSIAFARDGRLSGPELGKSLVKGMLSTGINVIDIGMLPTPLLYFAAAELTNGTGVMLTGSHNPPDYNGIKMVLGGETLSGDTIQLLRQRILKGDLVQGSGNYKNEKVLDKYLQRVTSDVKLKRKLKIVIDCGNGVAGAVAPTLFKQLGCDVTELFCEVDGNFPNHHPDPSQPENLSDLITAVKKQNADLGLAFDGDGDRIGVVSGDGRVIWPDRLMMLFARDVLSRNLGGKIIYDIKCSSNLGDVITEAGGEPLMWKTGHSLIKAKMKETNALLAGEMSGHIFFKERWYGFDDALYSAARLLEIMAGQLRQPRVVFSNLIDSVNTPELKINMEEGEHFKFIDQLSQMSSSFDGAKICLIDGIRVDYEDGWGLVRASNTTPCLVLRFEGKDKAAMGRVQEKFREVLIGIRSDLNLPF